MRFPLLSLAAAVALSAAPLLAQPLPLGPEIVVDPQPRFTQSLAASQDGSFGLTDVESSFFTPADTLAGTTEAMEWLATRGDGYVQAEIRGSAQFQLGQMIGRLLDAAGRPVSPELVLVDGVKSAWLVGDPAGGFVVVWTDFSFYRQVRRFDATGNPVGPIARVETDAQELILLPGGGFAVVGGDWSSRDVFVRLYRPDGSPATSKILLAEGIDMGPNLPQMAADGSGRIVVTWSREYPGSPDFKQQIWARRVDASGQILGPAFLVTEIPVAITQRGLSPNQDVAARPDGSFLVLWGETDLVVCGGPGGDGCSGRLPDENGDTWARAYDAAGAPLGPAFLVSDAIERHQEPGLLAAYPGGWIASWTTTMGPATGLRARRILAPGCGGAAPSLCLQSSRFRAEVTWRVPATGATGTGTPIPLTGDTGAFWFFSPSNYELVVKVLDGRGVNGHFWVFFGSLTDVEFDLTVTDTLTGQQRTYHNPAGTMASRADTEAF